jgi:predicted RNA-binding protein (virulence factor B family)
VGVTLERGMVWIRFKISKVLNNYLLEAAKKKDINLRSRTRGDEAAVRLERNLIEYEMVNKDGTASIRNKPDQQDIKAQLEEEKELSEFRYLLSESIL